MKRVLDIAISLLALALLGPLFVVVSVAIVVDSGLPIFFRQTRVGERGREFGMLKFRSMSRNAAAVGPYFTGANDERITRVGRFIRCTSVDELPQFMNVLRGEMSLVGPRPDLPLQQSLYRPEDWRQRCTVKPGITGLAQVRGRSEMSFEQRLSLDLQYAQTVSVWQDVRIMWWTLNQLGGRNAN